MDTREKTTFAQRHRQINFILNLTMSIIFIFIIVQLTRFVFASLGRGIDQFVGFLKKFVSTTDKVIIVAMITGTVSIIGVVFTSVIAKIVDYRYNVKKYLYDKREVPYKQFICMIYTIMADTKKPPEERMTELQITNMMSELSQGLTLWGTNKVVKKWLKYKRASLISSNLENLLLLEDIIYEIRKDVGQRKKMGKGDMLAFFINDIEKLIEKYDK